MNDEWWMMNDEWWMMNDEWWMMNDEWWMMNDEWWIVACLFRLRNVTHISITHILWIREWAYIFDHSSVGIKANAFLFYDGKHKNL